MPGISSSRHLGGHFHALQDMEMASQVPFTANARGRVVACHPWYCQTVALKADPSVVNLVEIPT